MFLNKIISPGIANNNTSLWYLSRNSFVIPVVSEISEGSVFVGKIFGLVTDADNQDSSYRSRDVGRVLGHISWLLDEAQKSDSADTIGNERDIKRIN
ncbi:hypothetical protein RhiirA4_459965 [Rhizophagus irregularis]|uniref:Uncharacterized protein n=1 Tax=Rhizophagus irregularis TaxID=588596 RepID=A0A2I1GFJ1_9GLOM|nr:hypothetical protein RhiirA4_459965 [Rhizophagus irregularis]